MTLGEKLQELRKNKLMSQEEFAEVMNVSRQAVSKWEMDQSTPEMDRLIEISNYYNVTLDYLLKQQVDELTSKAESASQGDTVHRIKSNDFDIKMFILIVMAIVLTSFRFIIMGDFKTSVVLVVLACIISAGLYIVKRTKTN